MKLFPYGLLVGAISVGAPAASAQTNPQGDPRDRLSMFAGTWTVEGSEGTYRETCEWLTRESFVVCRAEDTNPAERDVSLSIMGYSPEEQAYTYAGFQGSGGSRTLRGWVRGDRWVFTGGPHGRPEGCPSGAEVASVRRSPLQGGDDGDL